MCLDRIKMRCRKRECYPGVILTVLSPSPGCTYFPIWSPYCMNSVKVNCCDHFSILITLVYIFAFWGNLAIIISCNLAVSHHPSCTEESNLTGNLAVHFVCRVSQVPIEMVRVLTLNISLKNPQDDVLSTRNCVVPMIPKTWNTPTGQGQPGAS